MEREKKYYPLYIVAIILLGIHTVWLVNYYRGNFYWRFILEQASYIVLILGMLSKKTNFLTVGAFSRTAICLINTIIAIPDLMRYHALYGKVTFQAMTGFGFVIRILSCIAWALLAVSTIKREKAVSLCIAGAIVYLVGAIATSLGLEKVLMWGMDIAFLILCGILLQKGCIFTAKEKTAPKAIVRSSNPYEDILKLKELLDSGVITQEEFNEKKEQLLGL